MRLHARRDHEGRDRERACSQRPLRGARGRPEGREAYDAVTARAVARLATLAELASPLLQQGGTLVAWKGRRDPEEEAELEGALAATAMEAVEVLEVGESAGYEHRHLHILRKSGPTPAEPARAAQAWQKSEPSTNPERGLTPGQTPLREVEGLVWRS